MSRAATSLLVRLGAACQRSLGVALADTAAAPSCSYTTFAAGALSAHAPALRLCSLASSGASPSWLPSSGAGTRGPSGLAAWPASTRGFASGGDPRPEAPEYFVGLGNLRDNPGATRQRIRVGRGDSGRRNKYGGRGMKGQKAHGRGPHILFDGGQLHWLKFPVTRQRPSYEVLYAQLGLSRVAEFVALGLLDPSRTITMKHLYDSGCVTSNIKYGVMLYGKARLSYPLDLQVTACAPESRASVEAAGGRVTRVYYTREGLGAVLHPEKFTERRLPLPLPPPRWHPRHDAKFDAIGLIPPAVQHVQATAM
ncbi:hypothetical protein HYH03_007216 [Edaphochlamys debaryana]|uniref:Large ribosomal subunit protein uL15/eL18 domain-containing protein n=1 Tax=Edaphochlamys debaryana TaxID=47281 RepID=A0A835Y2F8_9CHLO|nr:hypothetical protein HYH03_007216 [Edaphochlamys debaryana]|eukprot:KAG2494701.1 hypothetical protein HYH03_007216 [Edaphochlamys debaryana]